jgi:hypothetical protein
MGGTGWSRFLAPASGPWGSASCPCASPSGLVPRSALSPALGLRPGRPVPGAGLLS